MLVSRYGGHCAFLKIWRMGSHGRGCPGFNHQITIHTRLSIEMAHKIRQFNARRTKYWPDTVAYSPILEPGTKPAITLPKREQQVFVMVEFIYSVKQTYWQTRRSPAIRQQTVCRKCPFLIQVDKYLMNNYRVFDTGNDAYISPTFVTGFYIDIA